jgi:hypothetical protein
VAVLEIGPAWTEVTRGAGLLLIVDGHVHITNRVCWEGLDP